MCVCAELKSMGQDIVDRFKRNVQLFFVKTLIVHKVFSYHLSLNCTNHHFELRL